MLADKENALAHKRVSDLYDKDPASRLLGIIITVIEINQCQLTMTVNDKMTNGYDLCHGGFIFTLADTAMAFVCAAQGESSVTTNAQIEFLHPAKLHDELTASARITLQNGRHLYCDIEITNQDNTPIAISRGHQVSVKSPDKLEKT